MTKGALIFEGNEKQVFATDHPDQVIFRYKDVTVAFNNVKRARFKGKGALDNQISAILLDYLNRNGVETHYIRTLGDQEQLCRKIEIIPLQVVVHNRIAGSLAYRLGVPEGFRHSNTIVDLRYNNDELEDPFINRDHAVALGLATYQELDGMYNNARVAQAIEDLLARGGLILGICNGFQALVKSGLLPYGHLGMVTHESPTLFRNDINRHISQMATTRVSTTRSPWLAGMQVGDLHTIAVSHGEGKFMVSEALAKELFAKGQVAFQYVNPFSEEVTMEAPFNPNGSYYAIEGIISPNGQILGKMGHTERWEPNVFKNIEEELYQPLFDNAVKYFKK